MVGQQKSDIDLFFEAANVPLAASGTPCPHPDGNAAGTCRKYGALYHLRKNIDACIGSNAGSPIAPWPAAMCIVAGIDLLSTFYAGEDALKPPKHARITAADQWKFAVGTRFKKFISDFFPAANQTSAPQLYSLRCSLLHQFGVVNRTDKFRLVYNITPRTLVQAENVANGVWTYRVDIAELYDNFEHSIQQYETVLRSNPISQEVANFNKLFTKAGYLLVFSIPSLQTAQPMPLNFSGVLSPWCVSASGV